MTTNVHGTAAFSAAALQIFVARCLPIDKRLMAASKWSGRTGQLIDALLIKISRAFSRGQCLAVEFNRRGCEPAATPAATLHGSPDWEERIVVTLRVFDSRLQLFLPASLFFLLLGRLEPGLSRVAGGRIASPQRAGRIFAALRRRLKEIPEFAPHLLNLEALEQEQDCTAIGDGENCLRLTAAVASQIFALEVLIDQGLRRRIDAYAGLITVLPPPALPLIRARLVLQFPALRPTDPNWRCAVFRFADAHARLMLPGGKLRAQGESAIDLRLLPGSGRGILCFGRPVATTECFHE